MRKHALKGTYNEVTMAYFTLIFHPAGPRQFSVM